jgi:collagenase-like PrtC family protease
MINDLKKLYSHLRLSGEVRQARKVAGIINRYAQQTDQPEEVSPLLSPWERGLEEPYTWTEGQKKVYNLIKGLDLTGTPRC